MTAVPFDATFSRDILREPDLRFEVVAGRLPGRDASRGVVGLAMLTPAVFPPLFFLRKLQEVLTGPRVGPITADTHAPALDERLQKWSMRLAARSAHLAHARGHHTAQVELWARVPRLPEQPLHAALCQITTLDAASLDDVVHALGTMRWSPDLATGLHDVLPRSPKAAHADFQFQRLMTSITSAASQRRA
ncbi:hypothetical protein [Paraburkholderia sp. J8-2]|uniref:hypothetical protein n=1 Tax=Paraburkholderia sp. J8-2 TaxID=2805440 RepID=UPI002AB75A5B|nr:hypothetical protein [Paraburkholderia sp. J8-2]